MQLVDRWLAAAAIAAVLATRIARYPKTYYGSAFACLAAAVTEVNTPTAIHAVRIAAALAPLAAVPRPGRVPDAIVYTAAAAVALAPLAYEHSSDAAWLTVPFFIVGCAIDALGMAIIVK